MHENEAFAVLTSIPYLGPARIRHLIEKFGSALNALKTNTEVLEKIPGFAQVIPHWEQRRQNPAWKNDLALVEKHNIQLIPYTHPLFPKSLLETTDHPVLLYLQGELKLQDQRSIAIVGTRNASIYGNEMAHHLGNELGRHGFTVVSGLARGIDTAAHRGALENGRTIAVIGSGIADIYPPENRLLAQEISKKGALISEFNMAAPPDRQNFPQRNRIVSGMTLGTLLIEAPIKSGAMITMEKALSQKRKLFALPGRADQENFRGNHLLIKNGNASLVENVGDILRHYDGLFPIPTPGNKESLKINFDPLESALLAKMPREEMGIDALAHLTGLPIHQVHTALMGLVLKKAIKEFPGKLYKKNIT